MDRIIGRAWRDGIISCDGETITIIMKTGTKYIDVWCYEEVFKVEVNNAYC